jgi:hypothetical protein
LNEYYGLTDRSSAYIAAVVLHPSYKWRFVEKYWAPLHPDWIQPAKDAVEVLWQRYKAIDVPTEIVEEDNERQQPQASTLNADDYYAGCYLDDDEDVNENMADKDEFAVWLLRGKHKDDRKVADPIAYWISKLHEFPRVARMALDLMSAPAMSTSNERDFNQTGLIWTSNRSTLDAEVLGATMAMASWDREMLINMVDGKLQHGRVRKRHIDEVSAQSGESDSSEDDGNSDSE